MYHLYFKESSQASVCMNCCAEKDYSVIYQVTHIFQIVIERSLCIACALVTSFYLFAASSHQLAYFMAVFPCLVGFI